MAAPRPLRLSKLQQIYTQFLSGEAPHLTSPDGPAGFLADLFCLSFSPAQTEWLSVKLEEAGAERMGGELKDTITLVFTTALRTFRVAGVDDLRKACALETIIIFSRAVLRAGFSSAEIMSILCGGVKSADEVFTDLVAAIDDTLRSDATPPELRHRTLQLALVFVCGIHQGSVGAFFQRRDLFITLTYIISSPPTAPFTFEATLLIGLLSNFHKAEAKHLNRYLQRIKDLVDEEVMRKIIWVAGVAMERCIAAYVDRTPPSGLSTSVTSYLSSWLPAALKPSAPPTVDAPTPIPTASMRDLFKDMPLEPAVILLPLYELLHSNAIFTSLLLSTFSPPASSSPTTASSPSSSPSPPPSAAALLALTSHLLTHASSSARAQSYAHLALACLLALVENDDALDTLCLVRPEKRIQLCRQREPVLPEGREGRPPVEDLLDCAVAGLRWNLAKRLDVGLHLLCVRVVQRVVWYLQDSQIRLEYHWSELWRAVLGLLEFVNARWESLSALKGIGELLEAITFLLISAVRLSEAFLPSPQAYHDLLFHLLRAPSLPSTPLTPAPPSLRALTQLTSALASRLPEEIRDVDDVMRAIADATSSGDLLEGGVGDQGEVRVPGLGEEPMRCGEEVDAGPGVRGFTRWACADGLALMPV